MYNLTIYSNETGLDTSIKVNDDWFAREGDEIAHDLWEMQGRVSGKVDVRVEPKDYPGKFISEKEEETNEPYDLKN
jgi:hypothetical protein